MKKHLLYILLAIHSIGLPAQSYYFQQYSVGEGLPQSQVYALLHDSRGYLWLGTQGGGIARYDGRQFVNFSVKNGLAGNYVHAVAEDDRGNLWIGTNQGVSRYNGHGFRNFDLGKNQPFTVYSVTKGKPGTVWLATNQGIFSIKQDSLVHHSDHSGIMYSAFTDRSGNVWMGGAGGIFRQDRQAGEWENVWEQKREVLGICETADGKIVAAVFNHGVLVQEGNKWRRISESDGLPGNYVQAIWTDAKGDLWIGTQDNGIAILNGRSLQPDSSLVILTAADGLCNNNIRSITGDRWGNIWLGTSGGGVCKYSGQEFEHFTREQGLRSNFVYSLAQDTSGGLWLSAGDRGVSFYDNGTFTHFGRDSGFLHVKCRAIYQDRQGRTWIGTEGAGLAVTFIRDDSLSKREFLLVDRNDGLTGNWIRDIEEDEAGNLWVATTDGGIGKVVVEGLAPDSMRFTNYRQREGLRNMRINALHFDRRGRLWFADHNGGIGVFVNEKAVMLGAKNGIPQTAIRSLAEDTLGYLWCGTAGRGIGRAPIYASENQVGNTPDSLFNFTFYGQNEGLTSSNIYLLQFDPAGDLWVGSESGVDRLRLDATRDIVAVRHYGLAEGFRGVEVCQNASLLDGNGSLWFGTVDGLTRYRPLADTGGVVKPSVHFTNVKLFYEPLQRTEFSAWATDWGGLKDSVIFPHNKNHLGFEFFAPNFSNPDRVEYSWQLFGLEAGWSPFTSRNEISYANLPPGDYTFRVRARNEDGVVGEPLTTSFSIEPPFWQTWWFRLTATAGVVLLVGGIFWLRIRQLRRQAAQEKAQLEMQNHLLQLEQKARQLQMNPHFIFNALNSIQSLVARKDFDNARQYILKFGRLMRGVLDNSRQVSIPLEKEIDTLRNYLEMEQFCRDGHFEFAIDTTRVESDDLQIPPMLLQPFVENAVLHGVAPLNDRLGRIGIRFTENGEMLKVEISDNGVGMSDVTPVKNSGKSRASVGIAVTRERLKILNGKLSFHDNPEGGTVVEVEVPFK